MFARTAYRFLLKLYPARFREEYEAPLEKQFLDDYRDAKGASAQAIFWLRALADLAISIPREAASEVRQDAAFALRVHRRSPLAAALAFGALTLAIGATTGIFSVLNAVLIRSLPFREPDRLVEVFLPPAAPWLGRSAVDAWLEGNRYLEDTAFYSAQPMNLGVGTESFRVVVCETTAGFLRMLGAAPAYGRGFSAEEDIRGRNHVAVIGYGLWQQAFGGDPRVLGSTIRLNDVPLTVVGVAPRHFDFPEKTAVWAPTAYGTLPSTYWTNGAIGRLKPGVSFAQASAMYRADIARLSPGRPKPRSEHETPRLFRLQDRLAGPVRPASLVLMGLMVFVLLAACANLAHLLLSRTTERRQELAVRAALGASRARLVRQLITEATLLTAAAAVAGLALAHWTASLAAVVQPAQLAVRQYSVLDWRVLGFALGVAVVTGILFGVLPASLIGRMQPGPDVIRTQPGSRGSAATRARGILIAFQAALAVTLAAGSFSMGRSFLRLMGIDLGYRTGRVVTMSVSLPSTENRTASFVREALERLRAVPGVESAGAASYLPLVPSKMQEGTFFTLDPGDQRQNARVMLVTPDYFRSMETPLIEGREFTATDRRGAGPVVIVTEEFARKYPGRKLVGAKMRLTPARVDATIVGVVRSHRFEGPESNPWEAIYRPMDQYEQWFATFVAKVRGDPESYLAACRDAVQATDRGVPVFDVKTLDQRLADTLARPRFYTTAIVFLAGLALFLAVIGVYGAAAHSIAQRTHEIGIRLALGSSPGHVRRLLLRQSLLPVGYGMAVGLAAAAALGKYLKHLMTSAEPVSALACLAAALLLAATAAVAVWAATGRILRIDPASSLKTE